MTTHKRTIHLTDDNWADYFSGDYTAGCLKRSTHAKALANRR